MTTTVDNYFSEILINTTGDLQKLWAALKVEGFFGEDGDLSDYYWDVSTEDGRLKPGERWVSNGVVELKFISSDVVRLYNFMNVKNLALGRIAAAVK